MFFFFCSSPLCHFLTNELLAPKTSDKTICTVGGAFVLTAQGDMVSGREEEIFFTIL